MEKIGPPHGEKFPHKEKNDLPDGETKHKEKKSTWKIGLS